MKKLLLALCAALGCVDFVCAEEVDPLTLTPTWTWAGSGSGTATTLSNGDSATAYTAENTRTDISEYKIPANSFTLSFWTKDHAKAWRDYAAVTDGSKILQIQRSGNVGSMSVRDDGSTALIATFDSVLVQENPLHLLTVVQDAGAMTIYVDGFQKTTGDISSYWNPAKDGELTYLGLGGAPTTTGGELKASGVSRGCPTSLADVRLYDKALTADEVKALYTYGWNAGYLCKIGTTRYATLDAAIAAAADGATVELLAPLTIAEPLTLALTDAKTVKLTGTISGAENLTVSGSGTLDLSDADLIGYTSRITVDSTTATLRVARGQEALVTLTGGRLEIVVPFEETLQKHTPAQGFVPGSGNVIEWGYMDGTFKKSGTTELDGAYTPNVNIWTAAADNSGNWSDSERWSHKATPTSGETLEIAITEDTTLLLTESVSVENLLVTGEGTLTIAAGESASNPTLTVNGILEAQTTIKITAKVDTIGHFVALNGAMLEVADDDTTTIHVLEVRGVATPMDEDDDFVGGVMLVSPFVKDGNGTLKLAPSETYDNVVMENALLMVEAGTVEFGSNASVNHAMLNFKTNTNISANGYLFVTAGGLTVDVAKDATVKLTGGVIADASSATPGTFTKTGEGTFVATFASTPNVKAVRSTTQQNLGYAGTVDVNEGTLALDHIDAFDSKLSGVVKGGGILSATDGTTVTFGETALFDATENVLTVKDIEFTTPIQVRVTEEQAAGTSAILKVPEGTTAPAVRVYVGDEPLTKALTATDDGFALTAATATLDGAAYATLDAAINDAQAGDTVILLDNTATFPETTLPADVTIEMADGVDAPTTAPDDYSWVDGTLLPKDGLDFINKVDSTGTGWEWDADTKVLTLNGFNISVAEGHGITVPDGTTIILASGSVNNITTAGDKGICALGNLTVKTESTEDGAKGTLNITAPNRGIEYYLKDTSTVKVKGAAFSFENIDLNVTAERGVSVFYSGSTTMSKDANTSISMSNVDYNCNYNGTKNQGRAFNAWSTAGDASVTLTDSKVYTDGVIYIYAIADGASCALTVTGSTVSLGSYAGSGGASITMGDKNKNIHNYLTINDSLVTAIEFDGPAVSIQPADKECITLEVSNSQFFLAQENDSEFGGIPVEDDNKITLLDFGNSTSWYNKAPAYDGDTVHMTFPSQSTERGTITVNGETYKLIGGSDQFTYNRATGVLTVPGGAQLQTADGMKVIETTGDLITVAPGEITNLKNHEKQAIAQVNDVAYTTLAEALKNAQYGDTITLLGNVTEEDISFGANVSVNMNGHKINEESTLDNFLADNFFAETNEDGTITVYAHWFIDEESVKSGSYTLKTAKDLEDLAALVNGAVEKLGTTAATTFKDKTITLGSDIDLSGTPWPGIGVYNTTDMSKAFAGTFDGNGKTISNVIFANTDSNTYRGFFNQLYQATVQNLTVEGKGFESGTPDKFGGAMIAGYANESTIDGCVAEGSFSGTHNVAGIAVRIRKTTIKNCTNKAELENNYTKLGGIVAFVQNLGDDDKVVSEIENCVNEGAITSTGDGSFGVGGIIGWVGYPPSESHTLTIKDCVCTGLVMASEGNTSAVLGQFVGFNSQGPHTIFEGTNKGLTATVAVGEGNTPALTYATVTEESGVQVATYTATLAAGNTYLVTAAGAKPVIELAAGESISFDTTLATIDDAGITATTPLLEPTTVGNVTTYAAAVAQIGDGESIAYYDTLQEAIDAASAGDTITLLGDTAATGITIAADDNVIVDLGGYTVTGDFMVYGKATIQNGAIVNNAFVSGIEANGDSANLTLEDLTVTSTRHALRLEGGTTVIKSGTYSALGRVGETETVHAVNAGGNCATTVTIEGGTFNGIRQGGFAETPDSGAAVNAQANATVTITGGVFQGGQNHTLATSAGGTIAVSAPTEALFDQDPTEFIVPTDDKKNYLTVLQDDNYYHVVEVTNWIQIADAKWYTDATEDAGTAEKPYVINSAEQLAGLAQLVNGGNTFEGKTITLGDNIDLAGLEWTPIGDGETYLAGTFRGNEKTISSLKIDTTADCQGLFGYTYLATIKNITLSNADITGSYYHAALVGYASTSTIQDCVFEGEVSVSGNYYFGGVVGYADAVTIENCAVNGALTLNNYWSGGIVGYGVDTVIRDCSLDGDITLTGESMMGGVAGYLNGASAVTGCRIGCEDTDTTVTITSEKGISGGLVGYSLGSTSVTDCLIKGTIAITATTVSEDSYAVGGMIGYLYSAASMTDLKVDATMELSAPRWVGGITGYIQGGHVLTIPEIKSCSVTGDITLTALSGNTSAWTSNVAGLFGTGPNFYVKEMSDCHLSGKFRISAPGDQVAGIMGAGKVFSLKGCTVVGTNLDDTGTKSYIKSTASTMGGSQVAGIIGYEGNDYKTPTVIDGCKVENVDFLAARYSGGTIAGYVYPGVTVQNCAIKDVTFTCLGTEEMSTALFVGTYEGTATQPVKLYNNTYENSIVNYPNMGEGGTTSTAQIAFYDFYHNESVPPDTYSFAGTSVTFDENGKVTGGTFEVFDSTIAASTILAPGLQWVANANGTYSVFEPVCQIGDTPYPSLQAALDAATEGDTITLLKDIALTDEVNVGTKKLTVASDTTLAITGTGSITGSVDGGLLSVPVGTTVSVASSITNDAGAAILAQGNLTITSGTVTGKTNAVVIDAGDADTTISITGGTFKTLETRGLPIKSDTVTNFITGGTFDTFSDELESYLADGYMLEYKETTTGEGEEETTTRSYEVVGNGKFVAKFKNTGYTDLQVAINDAVTAGGGTVKLLKDVTDDNVEIKSVEVTKTRLMALVSGNTVDIDLNGNTLKHLTITEGKTAGIKDTNPIETGKIEDLDIEQGATGTVSDVTVTEASVATNATLDNQGTVTTVSVVEGSTLKGAAPTNVTMPEEDPDLQQNDAGTFVKPLEGSNESPVIGCFFVPEDGGTAFVVEPPTQYLPGNEVKIKAEPENGYFFAGWTSNTDFVSADAETSVTIVAVDDGMKLTAHFLPAQLEDSLNKKVVADYTLDVALGNPSIAVANDDGTVTIGIQLQKATSLEAGATDWTTVIPAADDCAVGEDGTLSVTLPIPEGEKKAFFKFIPANKQ